MIEKTSRKLSKMIAKLITLLLIVVVRVHARNYFVPSGYPYVPARPFPSPIYPNPVYSYTTRQPPNILSWQALNNKTVETLNNLTATLADLDESIHKLMQASSRQERELTNLTISTTTASPESVTLSNGPLNHTSHDYESTSMELKKLRLDLEKTADLLKKNDYTVHSAMFKALQTYVASIERRVDAQVTSTTTTRDFTVTLKAKIESAKAKVSELLARLKQQLLFISPGNVGVTTVQ